MKIGGFHERPLARNCNPYVFERLVGDAIHKSENKCSEPFFIKIWSPLLVYLAVLHQSLHSAGFALGVFTHNQTIPNPK